MNARALPAHSSDEQVLELRILNGLHRGATLPLDGDAAALGSDESNDIVLLDPGIEPRHARVLRDPQPDPQDIDFDAAADPAPAHWQLHVHDGNVLPLRLEHAVALGPLRIVLAHEGAPWEPWINESSPAKPAPTAEVEAPPSKTQAALPLSAVWIGAGVIGIVAGLLTLTGLYDVSASPDTTAKPMHAAALPASAAAPATAASAPVLIFPTPPAPASSMPTPPFTLASVTAAFVVTPSGERLLPGDSYQGYRLISIELHSVLFSDPRGIVTALAW